MKHYRYESHIIYHETLPADVSIYLVEFESVKETKFGYWIIENYLLPSPIFVLKQSKKRYAYPTKEEAFNSLTIRNFRRIGYLKRDLNHAENLRRQILNFKL